jgi:hypothetical protein
VNQFDPREFLDVPDPFASDNGAHLRAPDVDALPPSPTRSRTRVVRLGALGAAIVCEAMFISLMGLRDTATLSYRVVGYGIALPLAVAAVALGVLQKSASRRDRVLAAIAGGVVVFFATTLLAQAPGDESLPGMVRCIVGGGMMAAGPALLAVFAMRRAFATGATWRTAALGLASGLIGAAATRLYCPNDAFAHVLIGHGAPILLAVVAAAALGPRFTRA